MNVRDWCDNCGGTGTEPDDPSGHTCGTCNGDGIVDK